MKAAVRPFVNVSTAGAGAPVASTAEDIFSVSMAFVAIIFPVLIIFFLIFLIWFFVSMRKRRKRKRAEKEELEAFRRAAQEAGTVDVPRDRRR
jgi:TRAP-type C4-dicarboxylate transport system permease large subunit